MSDMSTDKDFDVSELSKIFSETGNYQNNDFLFMLIIIMLFIGFFPKDNETTQYLKGKIDAYENILKEKD